MDSTDVESANADNPINHTVKVYALDKETHSWQWTVNSNSIIQSAGAQTSSNDVKIYTLVGNDWIWRYPIQETTTTASILAEEISHSSHDSNNFVVTNQKREYAHNLENDQWEWSCVDDVSQSSDTSKDNRKKIYSFDPNSQRWSWDKSGEVHQSPQLSPIEVESQKKVTTKAPIEVYSLNEETDEWEHTSSLVYCQLDSSGDWVWKAVPKECTPTSVESSQVADKSETNAPRNKVYSFHSDSGAYSWTYSREFAASLGEEDVVRETREFSLQSSGWGWSKSGLGEAVTGPLPVQTPLVEVSSAGTGTGTTAAVIPESGSEKAAEKGPAPSDASGVYLLLTFYF